MKTLFRFICICTFMVLGLAGCSGDDCTLCPEDPPSTEKEYQFLYLYNGRDLAYTFSTKTGLLLDSTRYPGDYPFWDVSFSKDGRYAYYTGYSTWSTDFATGDTIAIESGVTGRWNFLSSDRKYLLVGGYGSATRLFGLPNLDLVYQKENVNSGDNGTIHPSVNMAFVPYKVDSILIIDFRSQPVSETTKSFYRVDGSLCGASNIAVSKDGEVLILSGGTRLQLRDSETFELLQEYAPGRGTPYLHPDGERVFFIEWRNDFGRSAELWELNLKSTAMTLVLHEYEVILSHPFAGGFNPSDMDFTPDGRYAFIVNGGQGLEWGAILKVDCSSYKIVDVIYPPPSLSQRIFINPREIKGE